MLRSLNRAPALIALLLTPAIHAAESQESAGIEEVVVTAQKVAQNQQSVPIAVTAFGEEQMRVNRIESMVDVAQRTPGMVATEVNPAESNLVLRGIGTEGIDSNAGGDASVVTFVDGVYIGRGGGANLDLLDLERVEVLRGPQGTLFGKNVVGGLVNLVTRKPSEDAFGDVAVTVGNEGRTDVRGRVNRALSDTVFVSAAAVSRQHDGYTKNATTGTDVDDEDIFGARAAVRFAPNDTFALVVSAEVTRQRQEGKPRDNVCDPTWQAGIHCVGVDPDERTVNAITDGFLDRDVEGISAEINWTMSLGTVTSITAYREASFGFEDPFFSNPVNPPAQIESINRNRENSDQLSQELRLAFDAFDARLDGIVGMYYLTETIERNEMLNQLFPVPASTGQASFPQDVDAESIAVFGELGYDIIESLRVIVGARMTWESKDAHLQGILVQGPGTPPPLSVPYDVKADEDWDAFTPRFVLQWTAQEDLMIYASASRGFKSGGYQGTAGTAASAVISYDPEYAWSYELGAKSQWFDNRLRVNVAGFHTDYEDLQVSQLVPLCCVVIGNAAEAEIDGIEVEVVVQPVAGLEINGNYTWLDAEYTSFASGATADYSGNTLPRAPDNKFNIGAQYTFPLAGLGDAFMRVDYTDQSKMYFEASNTPFEVQEGYDLLDARVALRASDGGWEVAVWGKNLTDELVKSHIVAFAPYRQELNTYQPPRTWGVTLTFAW